MSDTEIKLKIKLVLAQLEIFFIRCSRARALRHGSAFEIELRKIESMLKELAGE